MQAHMIDKKTLMCLQVYSLLTDADVCLASQITHLLNTTLFWVSNSSRDNYLVEIM